MVKEIKKTILQEDTQRGVSQDSLEDLRSEFLSIGGIVKSLPDPKSVRDNTIVMIRNTDYKVEVYDRWQMINGKWYWIGRGVPEMPYDTSGELYQKNLSTSVATTYNTLVLLTTGWTKDHLEHIYYNQAGQFKVESAGEYFVTWNMTITSAGTNKEYEVGVVLNGSEFTSGWSHTKCLTIGDPKVMSASAIMDLKIGDTVMLGVIARTSPTSNMLIEHANLTIFKRGI